MLGIWDICQSSGTIVKKHLVELSRFTLLNKISCIITSSFLALEVSLFLHIGLFPNSTHTLISPTTRKLFSIFLFIPQPLHNVIYMYILVNKYFYIVYIVTVFYEIFYPAYFLSSPFRYMRYFLNSPISLNIKLYSQNIIVLDTFCTFSLFVKSQYFIPISCQNLIAASKYIFYHKLIYVCVGVGTYPILSARLYTSILF